MSHVHSYVPSILYILIHFLFGTFLIVSLSFSLSFPLILVASWHLNINLFRSRTLFVPRLLLLLHLILLPLTFGSVMKRPNRTSWRTFHDVAFIRIAKSFCQISLTLTHPLSSIVGVGSHFVVSWSRALQFSTCVWGICIVVTPEIVFEVLHVPRVAHLPDYHGCLRLGQCPKTNSCLYFVRHLFSWGDRQNTSCSTFAKGSRILNMVMTFILHPLSHYNTIIEPRASLLLSLIEDLSVTLYTFLYRCL